MQSIIGMALLVVGVVLIIFGMQASASVGSRLSELFTGRAELPDHLALGCGGGRSPCGSRALACRATENMVMASTRYR